MSTDGRNATETYRVRTGQTWFLVDPTMPRAAIEPGDTVVLYPVAGDAQVAVVQQFGESLVFASLAGEHFAVRARDIAAMHLAVVDEED